MAGVLQRGGFLSPVGHEASDSVLPGLLPSREQELSPGEIAPVGA